MIRQERVFGIEMLMMFREIAGKLVVILLTICLSPLSVDASLLVTPARIETDVGPTGAGEVLTIVNRGDTAVGVRVYAGGARQMRDGSMHYLDDRATREIASDFIKIGVGALEVEASGYVQIPVRFVPMGDRVAMYHVIYVEVVPGGLNAPGWEQSTDRAIVVDDPLLAITRVAIPVLATNPEAEQRFLPRIVGISVQSSSSREDGLNVALEVRNEGNVHGSIAAVFEVHDPAKRLIDRLTSETVRILPGATRIMHVKWPPPMVSGQAAISARLDLDQRKRFDVSNEARTLHVAWRESDDDWMVLVAEEPVDFEPPSLAQLVAFGGSVDWERDE